MTENEFNQLADAALARIAAAVDEQCDTADCNRSGNLLEVEFDNGSKIIINRHDLNQEIWVAAKSGGFHFNWQNNNWVSQRDGSELFSRLVELFAEQDEQLTF